MNKRRQFFTSEIRIERIHIEILDEFVDFLVNNDGDRFHLRIVLLYRLPFRHPEVELRQGFAAGTSMW